MKKNKNFGVFLLLLTAISYSSDASKNINKLKKK